MKGKHRTPLPYSTVQYSPHTPRRIITLRNFNQNNRKSWCNTRCAARYGPESNQSYSNSQTDHSSNVVQHSGLAFSTTHRLSKKSKGVGILVCECKSYPTKPEIVRRPAKEQKPKRLVNGYKRNYSILPGRRGHSERQWKPLQKVLPGKSWTNRIRISWHCRKQVLLCFSRARTIKSPY